MNTKRIFEIWTGWEEDASPTPTLFSIRLITRITASNRSTCRKWTLRSQRSHTLDRPKKSRQFHTCLTLFRLLNIKRSCLMVSSRLDLNPQHYSTVSHGYNLYFSHFSFLCDPVYTTVFADNLCHLWEQKDIWLFVFQDLCIRLSHGNNELLHFGKHSVFQNLLTYFKTFSTMRLPSVTCYQCIFAPMYKSLSELHGLITLITASRKLWSIS